MNRCVLFSLIITWKMLIVKTKYQGTMAKNWGCGMHEARQIIVNKLMDSFKTHLPVSGEDQLELNELQKFTERFEEEIFTTATNRINYGYVCKNIYNMKD